MMDIRFDRDFRAPFGLIRHIQSAVKWIDKSDLAGIEFFLLMEDIPEISKQEDLDVILATENQLAIFGAYRPRSVTTAAHVILIVKNLYYPMPLAFAQSPGMTLRIAQTIAHEVGHHVRAEKRFMLRPQQGSEVLENEEEFAERYADSVITRMKSQRLYTFGDKLLRLAAAINYLKGVRAWKKQRYLAAAGYFRMTIQLQADHSDANYWYWEARKRLDAKEK